MALGELPAGRALGRSTGPGISSVLSGATGGRGDSDLESCCKLLPCFSNQKQSQGTQGLLLACTRSELLMENHPKRGLRSGSLRQELEIRPVLILCINQQEREGFIFTGWPASLPFTPHSSIDFIRICQAGMRAELGPLN